MGTRTGFFVTLEGGEGSGKTTQRMRIAAHLRDLRFEVLETREPGGTDAGEIVRKLLLHRDAPLDHRAELALYLACRAQLVSEVIRPALARGAAVVCDRFGDSSAAYQGGGRSLGVEWVEKLNDFATGGLVPDLTLYFDVPPDVGLARRSARAGGAESLDRIEREGPAFHAQVRATYLALAARHADRLRVIATDDGEEEVWARVRSTLDARLRERGIRP